MTTLLQGLLRLSRTANAALDRRPVDVSSLSWNVIEQLRSQHPDRAIEVVIQPGMLVDGDFGLVRALIESLLGNAWKFSGSRAAPRIEVGELLQGGARAIFVRDNGIGFDSRTALQLFGVFRRFHGADETEGTGVGLAIAQRIVNRHGGRIWAESEIGQGATFYFELGARS
jgi:light-regulated signal transduction histidine kinase (bacteriophytochrome)